MDTLIIEGGLTEPPSEILPLRVLGIRAKIDLHLTVVIESERGMVDFYYHFLKRQGIFDFLYQIILPEDRVEGIRIDTEYNYPMTIKTDRIVYENVEELLRQLASLRGEDRMKDMILEGLVNKRGLIN